MAEDQKRDQEELREGEGEGRDSVTKTVRGRNKNKDDQIAAEEGRKDRPDRGETKRHRVRTGKLPLGGG